MQKFVASKWLNVCLLFFVVTLPLDLGGCTSSSSLPTYNITGSWFMYHTAVGITGALGPDLFTFSQSENAVSGATPQGQTLSGNVTDVTVSFAWIGNDGFVYTYIGTIRPNTGMSGTWTSNNGQSGTWDAIIDVTPSVDIAGKWNITYTNAPGQQQSSLLTFTQILTNISGTTSQGEPITGNMGAVTIIFSWTGSDGAANIFTGTTTIEGITMSGTWTSTNGQSGIWNAIKSV